MAELLWYVHGVIPAADAQAADGLPGVTSEHPVCALVEGPVAALACRVPAEEFDERALREQLEDLAWVERVARAHESVLDELLPATTVVPMRMCTVYRAEDAVRAMLRDERAALTVALDRFAGATEWGVKAFAATPDPPRRAAAPARAASGTDYLLARRRQRDEAAVGARELEAAASEIHGTLAAIARDARAGRPQPAELTGRSEPMILNGSYLVQASALDAFHHALDGLHRRLRRTGIELESTGPWPPYHFLPDALGVGG